MSLATLARTSEDLIYPESDGQPMAENTTQYRYLTQIKGGLEVAFRDRPDVFIAGDLFWYPVEGSPGVRTAPDVMVAVGRPKGDRRSYLQWREGGQPPQVVFEILSPGNRGSEMISKFLFYQRHGVDEYYTFDPDDGDLNGWRRVDGTLELIPEMNGWVSPLLGIRFAVRNGDLEVSGPDGRPFVTYEDLADERDAAEAACALAESSRQAAEARRQAAEAERQAAEARRQAAEEETRHERERAERLAAKLRALGVTDD